MKSRFLLMKRGCDVCHISVKVVSQLNLRLPIENRIRIINCHNHEEFNVMDVPLLEVFSKMKYKDKPIFEGYPFLYIDGIWIDVAPSSKYLKTLLTSMLEEEFEF